LPATSSGSLGRLTQADRPEPGVTTPGRPPLVPAQALVTPVAADALASRSGPPAPLPRAPEATRLEAQSPEGTRPSREALTDATPTAAHATVQAPAPPLVGHPRVSPLPLRAETVRDATRAAGPAAPPVVHVTIDRIDVRLPPAAAPASPAAARARPASAQPALGDYLRANGTRSPHGGRR
jgi:hypothetical protein